MTINSSGKPSISTDAISQTGTLSRLRRPSEAADSLGRPPWIYQAVVVGGQQWNSLPFRRERRLTTQIVEESREGGLHLRPFEALQILYFTMCVVADMLDEKSKDNLKSWLEDAKNFLFTVIVFPYTWFSVTSFWTMYHVDEEYVFPRALQDLCPPWVNHGVHTNILVVVLLEVVLSPRHLVMSRMKGAVVLAISLVAYNITYLSGNILYGAYLYPFCTWLYTSEMVMVLIGFNIWIICFYILGAKFVFTSNIKPQKTRPL